MAVLSTIHRWDFFIEPCESLQSDTYRELKIFGLDAVGFDGKADKCIAKFWEVVAEARLLVVPATLTVICSLC